MAVRQRSTFRVLEKLQAMLLIQVPAPELAVVLSIREVPVHSG